MQDDKSLDNEARPKEGTRTGRSVCITQSGVVCRDCNQDMGERVWHRQRYGLASGTDQHGQDGMGLERVGVDGWEACRPEPAASPAPAHDSGRSVHTKQ